MKKVFVFFILLMSGSTVMPCAWCEDDAPLPVLAQISHDARSAAKRSGLLAGCSDNTSEAAITSLSLIDSEQEMQAPFLGRFYSEYLCTYFPKADVMTSLLFPTMCSKALCLSVASLVYFLNRSYWRYFANDPGDVHLERLHLGIINKQLKGVMDWCETRLVDQKTGMTKKRAPALMRTMPALIRWWKHLQQAEPYYYLVALLLDSTIHRLYFSVHHQNYSEARALQSELSHGARRLAGSQLHARYTKIVELYAELVKMLYEREWGDGYRRPVQEAQGKNPLETWRMHSKGIEKHEAFIASFIGHYECSVTGKFTHEYHPALLEKTAESFGQLEHAMHDNAMPIVGRYMLMGYEEQGIPRYFTHYDDALFSDEMENKTVQGWSLKMFNRFGLLTGFLFKDANKTTAPVTHIDADTIEIFRGNGTIFQEHAFGDAFVPLMRSYSKAHQALEAGNSMHALSQCCSLWNTLYGGELKVSGKQHIAGTQDVFFSLSYMHHVLKSSVPLLHFYVGPDITYPIETSLLHNTKVTAHAQQFVQAFMPNLTALNGKKTAYVFCSFVDGVGKSTMLGNVQNWMKHGNAIEKYEHVDNSSSQLATIFPFSDDVVIADLPAQVSHFTYKPDGYVYVDAGALYDEAKLEAVKGYVLEREEALKKEFAQALAHIGSRCAQEGFVIDALDAENPEYAFMALLHLFKKQASNEWISFTFEGVAHLFHADDTSRIRVRVPLADAPSHGLKNNLPEQMIFSRGIRFPFAYEAFLDDLTMRLKEQGVEQVVMVDFMSMYSRSSRENIRVNYLLQQLALVYESFSVRSSFYQDFVDSAQLLGQLNDEPTFARYIRGLMQESVVRYVLFKELDRYSSNGLSGVSLQELTKRIFDEEKAMNSQIKKRMERLVEKKLRGERERLREGYGRSRKYITLYQPQWKDLIQFTALICGYGAQNMRDDKARQLALQMEQARMVHRYDEQTKRAVLQDGTRVKVLARIHPDSREKEVVEPLVKAVRSAVTAYAANLLYLGHSVFPVLPLRVLHDAEGMLCAVVPLIGLEPESWAETRPDYSLFNLDQKGLELDAYCIENQVWYCTAWDCVSSSGSGAYACGHEQAKARTGARQDPWKARPIVTNLYSDYAREHGEHMVMPYEKLWSAMKVKTEALERNKKTWKEEAERNGVWNEKIDVPSLKGRSSFVDKGGKVYGMAPGQDSFAQLFVRIIATMEMLVKDLDADFVVRRSNKNDFVACIAMMEAVTLSWVYGLYSDEPLFDDYEKVEPLVEL